MRLFCIWVCDGPLDPENAWLLTAWDEYSVENNYEGWEEELQKAHKNYTHVRVCEVKVDREHVEALFKNSVIPGWVMPQEDVR